MSLKKEIKSLQEKIYTLELIIEKYEKEKELFKKAFFNFLGLDELFIIIDDLKNEQENLSKLIEELEQKNNKLDQDIRDLYNRSHDHY